MEAEAVLTDLERQGLKLTVKAGYLLVWPSQAITPEARSTIRTFKKELLKLVIPRCTSPAISADRLKIMRNLHRSGGLEAMKFLLAIRPKPGTYLGLPRVPVNTPKVLELFASALDHALCNTKPLEHHSQTRAERKEITLLAAVLLPKGWTLQVKHSLMLLIHPPESESHTND